MKNKLILLPLLLPLIAAAPNASLNAISYSWTNEQGTTIAASGNGYNFTFNGAFNDSARLNQQVNLDGLSFDYTLTNAGVNQTAGFYFTKDTSHNLNNNTCTFTFCPKWPNSDQTRMGVYRTHDIDKSFSHSTFPLNQTGVVGTFGFGLAEHLVLNANVGLSLNFTFEKIGPFYKVSIREKNTDLIWKENANYTIAASGNFVYTYIEETYLPTDNGKVYMHVYGFKDSTGANPISYVGGITEIESNTATVTYNYNYFDASKKPVIEKISVDKNSKLEKPEDPSVSGLYFAGWYTDLFYTNKWNFEEDTVSRDMELFAKWVTDPKDIDPVDPTDPSKTSKNTVGYVVQLSQAAFATICVVLGLVGIGVIVLLIWLLKKLFLKLRGRRLLK